MGKTLLIANWKMNLTIHEASLFIHTLSDMIDHDPNVEIVLAPTMLALQALSLQNPHHQFKLAAQNFYWRDSGAYTGEVSATQLRGLVRYALVGHSERRHVFGERDRDLRNKVQAAYRNEITPVLCVGETASERALGETNDILHDQLVGGLSNITGEEAGHLVVAYEPVWAISNGKDFASHAVPTPNDAAQAAKAIRNQIAHLFGAATAKKVRVLYGGSVTADNAAGYLGAEGIDGLLVGGASLDVHSFAAIIDKAAKKKSPTKGKKK
ncbi:MAG: triose-phosphate isomerase [Candidatus Saccharibacteria bacterium]|nr:triose-phosphate isomerase [Candidatus Saccharibacteria bacterium]MCA9340318.1 triose-phosphate isomerase [Candidatus Saccharibacteria bacterium]